jgi:hypothetical protein
VSTRRKKSKATSSAGVNYVRQVVTSDNSIFQAVELDNNMGNDAYIEFILDEETTGCFVWVQIKSGESFKRKSYYALPADKDHFEYWNSNIAPVVGVVYDPEIKSAFWIDITDYLQSNPSAIKNGPYTLHISLDNELNSETFSEFKRLFLKRYEGYKKHENFGRALEYFATMDELDKCLEGLISLFVSYRNERAAWFYLINSFSSIEDDRILFQFISYLSLLSGHMDIFWHKDNIVKIEVEKYARSHLAKIFGITEVVKLLSIVDDWGFSRGSIGYAISAIISLISDKEMLLKSIAFNSSFDERMRSNALFLLIHLEQFSSIQDCTEVITEYLNQYPCTEYEDLFLSMKNTLETEGFLGYIG